MKEVRITSRQRWNSERFHRDMAVLVGVGAGDVVADLGCGRGASLGPLLDAAGPGGRVYGIDRMAQQIAEAHAHHADAVETGRLLLVQGDVLPPPFDDDSFDAVICENVIECVPERAALVSQCRRILKPGGRLLLGHHDFDAVIIGGGDRDLTRFLVHGFADLQQGWQDAAEGQMGRMLPGLAAHAGFESVGVETRVFVDLDLGEQSYARGYVEWIVDLASEIGVDPSDARHWADDLETAAAEGQFYFALPWIAAVCVEP